MEVAELYTIIESSQYNRCRDKLGNNEHILNDLDQVINQLVRNPRPPLTKALQGSLQGKHTVRFANQTHRLIVTINHSSKTIRLNYLASRAVVYNGKMWD